MTHRVLICGGRDFGDLRQVKERPEAMYEYLFQMADLETHAITLHAMLQEPEDDHGNWLPDWFVISGGARGADANAIDWAIINWCPFREFKADWKTHGKKAGILRNIQMLREGRPDLVIAYPGGAGTAHMVKIAKEAGIKVIEVTYNAEDQNRIASLRKRRSGEDRSGDGSVERRDRDSGDGELRGSFDDFTEPLGEPGAPRGEGHGASPEQANLDFDL